MKRLMVMTVGKTHSGKSTFARALKGRLDNACIIDQDNHAEFINAYYRELLPERGPNTLKHTVTEAIADYAAARTTSHLIFCNAYRTLADRTRLLGKFKNFGFTTVLINFNILDAVLESRVAYTTRSTTVFRSASSFAEVLARQQAESANDDVIPPQPGEADHFFVLESSEDSQAVIDGVLEVVHS